MLVKLPPWPGLHVDQAECHNDTSGNLVLFQYSIDWRIVNKSYFFSECNLL